MIRAVFFDLGGTLIDNVTFLEKEAAITNQKILREMGYSFSLNKIRNARLNAINRVENKYVGNSKKHTFGLYTFHFLKFLGLSPSMKLAIRINKKFRAEWDKHKRLMPHAKELLTFLKRRKLKLAIISNGSVSDVNHDLDLINIRKYFDLIVISGKFGKEKSTLVPFNHALKKLELNPKEVIVVGDRMDEDICSSKRLGCTTVRMNFGFWRNYRRNEYGEADYVARNLMEVKKILSDLTKSRNHTK